MWRTTDAARELGEQAPAVSEDIPTPSARRRDLPNIIEVFRRLCTRVRPRTSMIR